MKFLWTAVYVKNLDESVAFYSDLPGLKVMNRFQAGPQVEIAFMGNGTENETMIELLEDKSSRSVDFTECVSVGFEVDSVEAMLEAVKSRNIPVHGEPMETPASVFFFIKDPNGFNVQFFERKKG